MPDSALGGVLTPASQIGRYFSLVSGVPSLVITLLPIGLVTAGAPSRRPKLATVIDAMRGAKLAEFGLLAIIVVVIGLAIQPLQFALTQLLEGYWGSSAPGQLAMVRSTRRHLERYLRLEERANAAGWSVDDFDQDLRLLEDREYVLRDARALPRQLADILSEKRRRSLHEALPDRVAAQEFSRKKDKYPADPADLMPTRLGNMLRRHERLAGSSYGLDVVYVASALAQVTNETVRDYHDDARSELDLSTRMILVWTLSTMISVALLWQYDVWLLLPLSTSLLAWLAYRAAIASAEAYGEALTVLVSLGRKPLYDALGIGPPQSSAEEKWRNAEIVKQIRGDEADLNYSP
jgi:hypothetical protein